MNTNLHYLSFALTRTGSEKSQAVIMIHLKVFLLSMGDKNLSYYNVDTVMLERTESQSSSFALLEVKFL